MSGTALVRVADRFPVEPLAAGDEVHTDSGTHRTVEVPSPAWVPGDDGDAETLSSLRGRGSRVRAARGASSRSRPAPAHCGSSANLHGVHAPVDACRRSCESGRLLGPDGFGSGGVGLRLLAAHVQPDGRGRSCVPTTSSPTQPPRSSCSTTPSDRSAAQASSPSGKGAESVADPADVDATVSESSRQSSSPVSTGVSSPPTKGSPTILSTRGGQACPPRVRGACRLSAGGRPDREARRRPRAPALAASPSRGLSARVAAAWPRVCGAQRRAAASSQTGQAMTDGSAGRRPIHCTTADSEQGAVLLSRARPLSAARRRRASLQRRLRRRR